MKTIDMRFNTDLIRSWIGKKFNKYKCDAFEFTNSVTQIVGLYIEDEVYALTNVQEAVDYFGTTEDMAVAKLSASEENAASTQQTSASLTSLDSAMDLVVTQAEDLKGIADDLITDMSFFTVE